MGKAYRSTSQKYTTGRSPSFLLRSRYLAVASRLYLSRYKKALVYKKYSGTSQKNRGYCSHSGTENYVVTYL